MNSSPYIDHLRLSSGLSKYLDLKCHQMAMSLHYNQIRHALKKENKIVFTEIIMPSEIFYAFNLSTIFVESFGSFLSSIGKQTEILKRAEDEGINPNICAYHKCTYGALQSEYMPIPDLFVHSSYWCDDMLKMTDLLSEKYKRPSFTIDIPFNRSESATNYVRNQFKLLIKFLEEKTGRIFNVEKMREVISYSNDARKYWIKSNELRKEKNVVVNGYDTLRMLPMLLPKFGLPETVEIFKNLYDEISIRRSKIEVYGKKEKCRLLWLHFYPFYDTKLMSYIENTLGASIAFEENTDVYWPELKLDDPIGALTEKMLSHSGLGCFEKRINTILDHVKEYRIDGVVHFSQICCRPFVSSVPLIKRALDEINIPFLELSGDVLDSRNFSRGQTVTRLEAFIEMLT